MEKYKVDYGELSYFKGITIDFDYLEEGLDYAQRHNIKDVLVGGILYKHFIGSFLFLKGQTLLDYIIFQN